MMNQITRQEQPHQDRCLLNHSPQIENCYISVEINDEVVSNLKRSLLESLNLYGFSFRNFEEASSSAHVSLAYGHGKADLDRLVAAARQIAETGFQIQAGRFEILEGKTTPYDYLVLTLDADTSEQGFHQARALVESCMETKNFDGGFQGHISLLRYPKGGLSREQLHQFMRELNASQGAATALGRRLCLDGECVCIFQSNRECLVQVRMESRRTHVA